MFAIAVTAIALFVVCCLLAAFGYYHHKQWQQDIDDANDIITANKATIAELEANNYINGYPRSYWVARIDELDELCDAQTEQIAELNEELARAIDHISRLEDRHEAILTDGWEDNEGEESNINDPFYVE